MTPNLCRFPTTLRRRSAFISLPTIIPVFFISWAAGNNNIASYNCDTRGKSKTFSSTENFSYKNFFFLSPTLTDITGLPAGSAAHVQHPFVLLRCQSNDWQHAGRTLEHVVTRKVLGGGTWEGRGGEDVKSEPHRQQKGPSFPLPQNLTDWH